MHNDTKWQKWYVSLKKRELHRIELRLSSVSVSLLYMYSNVLFSTADVKSRPLAGSNLSGFMRM